MNSCQKFNTSNQYGKLINFDIAIRTETESLDQNCHGNDLDPSESSSNPTIKMDSIGGTNKLDTNIELNSIIENNKDKGQQINNIEEMKSDNNKILSTIKNEYLSTNCKNDLNPDGTLAHHRWGKKQDLKMFKTLRHI